MSKKLSQKLNGLALAFLLLGQVLLGPIGTVPVFAEGEVDSNAGDMIVQVAEDNRIQDEPASPTPDTAPDSEPKQDPKPEQKQEPESDSDQGTNDDANDEPDSSSPDNSGDKNEEIQTFGHSDDDGKEISSTVDCNDPKAGPGKSDCRHVYVKKIDPNGKPISGVTFTTSHPGKGSKSATTGEYGWAIIDFVHNGKNTLDENLPTGSKFCHVLNSNGEKVKKPIEFQGNKSQVFTFVNAPEGMNCDGTLEHVEKAELTVKKSFEGSGNRNHLEAKFTLTGPGQDGDVRDAKIRHNRSHIFSDLEDGVYTLREVSTASGYKTVSDQTIEVVNGLFDNDSRKKTINIVNKKYKVLQVTVNKKFEDNKGKKLKAKFKLICTNPDYEETGMTNNNGKLYFNNVPQHANCELIELEAPDGYKLADSIQFNSGKHDKSHNITNKKNKTVSVNINKSFEDGKWKNYQAQFKLTCTNYEETGWTNKKSGKLQFDKVPQNSKCELTEVSAPDGYKLIDPITFNSGKKGKTYDLTNKKLKTVSVKVNKSFEGGSTKKLSAEFKLICPDYESTGWTDKYGNIEFKNVPQSTDCELTEITTPDGYQTIDPKPFNSGKNGKTHKITNKKIKTVSVNVNKKFDGGKTKHIKAEFELTCSGYNETKWTNKHGKIEFKNVPQYADCELTEISTPDGYQTIDPITFNSGKKGKTHKITNEKDTSGKIIVTKVDGKTGLPLNGATFELSLDGELVDTQTTKRQGLLSHGIATFENLEVGKTYTLIETIAPNGYVINDEYAAGVQVTIDAKSNVAKIKVKNTKQAAVTLVKYDSETEELLPGAKFKLQVKLPIVGWTDVPGTGTLETDENGQINIRTLSWGSYRFVETEAPDGYEIGNTNKYPFTINKIFGETKIVNAYNTPVESTGSVSFYKLDGNTELGLPGATFILEKLNEETGEYEQYGDPVQSGSDGLVFVDELPYGEYRITETLPPAGYEMDEDNWHTFRIPIDVELLEPIWNYPTDEPTGEVNLYKHETGNVENGLDGAEFDLYKWNEETGEYELVEGSLETKNGGYLNVDDLEQGSYYFIETEAPTDYELDDTTMYYFEVLDDGTVYISGSEEMINVPNKREDPTVPDDPTGSVTILKHEAGNVENGLDGAIFDLYKWNEETGEYELVEGSLETKNGGYLDVDDLEQGSYYFIETKAPTNYILDGTTKYHFEILDDGTVYLPGSEDIINVPNKRVSGGGIGPSDPDPTDPGTPVVPTDPTDPADPGTPVDPTDPTDPTDPGTPVDPTDPTDPTDPGTPVDPTDPTDPADPGTPVDPKDPGVPVTPEDPIDPASPTDDKTGLPVKVTEKTKTELTSKLLPRTGEGVAVNMIVTGLLVSLLGGWLLFGRSKRRKSRR